MFYFMLIPLLFSSYLYKLLKSFLTKRRRLTGKHVCITGGSSGIGKSVAILAAQHGAHVTIIARNQQRLDDALEEIRKHAVDNTQQFAAVSLDCADYEAVARQIPAIDSTLPIYMFVNCAGYASCGVLESIPLKEVRQLFDVNYFATVYALQAVVPLMKQREDGVVVITGSQGGLMGIYGMSIYSSAKFALRGLAEALHMECSNYNVSVTLALPPDTDTPGFENENKAKPIETKLISEAGGLVQPEVVAEQILKDALTGNFYSYVGFESWLMTTLSVGMTPFQDFFEVVCQAALLGPIRVISSFYINKFQKIIADCKKEKKPETAALEKTE